MMPVKRFLGCVAVSVLSAWVLSVEHHVPADFATIADAVAASSDGDEVVVANGSYGGPGFAGIYVNKAITIRSAGGQANCTLDGGANGMLAFILDASVRLEGFTFRNYSSFLGVVAARSGAVVDCTFTANRCLFVSGVATLGPHPVTVRGCTFVGNAGLFEGLPADSAVSLQYGSTLEKCAIVGNSVRTGVQAIGLYRLSDCLVAANEGNGIELVDSDVASMIGNCTFSDNVGAGVHNYGANGLLFNAIIWGNGQQIVGSLSAVSCDVQGGWPGAGNNAADPLFANPSGLDYRLQPASPCIDAGIIDALVSTTDLDGNARSGPPDMGAFEFQSQSDPFQSLMDTISGLMADQALLPADGMPLIAKVRAASESASSGQSKTALNQLRALLNQLGALRKAKRITQAQHDQLATDVERIIDGIVGPLRASGG